MYKRTGTFSAVDRIYCSEIMVEKPTPDRHPVVTAKMVYSDAEGRTYGTCSWVESIPTNQTGNLSARTLDLVRQLMESLESDFGQVVFERGIKEDDDDFNPRKAAQDAAAEAPGPLKGLGGSS